MRKIAGLTLFLAAGFATCANAQAFLGSWTATAHMPGGVDSSETLRVTQAGSGYSVVGKAVDAQAGGPEAGPGTDVVLSGDNFSYKRTLNLGGNAMVISYVGTVSGETFTGSAELGGTKVPYTGVRAPTSK